MQRKPYAQCARFVIHGLLTLLTATYEWKCSSENVHIHRDLIESMQAAVG